MAFRPFLAMTAAEIRENSGYPPAFAWMACHFSPGGAGLSNLPAFLPTDSLLILDDSTPFCGHDPERIADQLSGALERWQCRGLLLDFQRPPEPETAALAARLSRELPVILPPAYAEGPECPLFLPPAPPDTPLAEYLAPWKNRELWLELALDGQTITLIETGAVSTPLPYAAPDLPCHRDPRLHSHYHIQAEENQARFTLWRTPKDIENLIAEAETLGVVGCVGLYQELGANFAEEDHCPSPTLE